MKINWQDPTLITVRLPAGNSVVAHVTTEHAASSYGLPVVVRDNTAYGVADTLGWVLLSAHREGIDALKHAGYPMAEGWDAP